ncbi:AAA family ATPase [Paractinoplanes maris]|uniref:AAA family ATPase n=1 Tax=Paractinoplanes maris TaxID=1734446 RepID=UPI00202038FD|nr:ATP-binding protein [Actinoplanes maris]
MTKPMAWSADRVLLGRQREQQTLVGLLRDVEAGGSRVLVLRGGAGSGKTALLEHLAAAAQFGQVIRVSGVELEAEIAYAGLHQLCAPLIGHLGRLPESQRIALSTALALAAGEPPNVLVVGLAVLSLLEESAAARPLICVVDDVQWLDKISATILTFVARRLGSAYVGLVFASRSPGDEHLLEDVPELTVRGLPYPAARALLDSVLTVPVDVQVRDQIIVETQGNPLALLELPRGRTAAELAYGFGGRNTTLVGQLEEDFQQRVRALPRKTQMVVLAAAVEPVGDMLLLSRALEQLGVAPDDASPAVAAGLLEFGAQVHFRHPLVRSAAWRSADPVTLRNVHLALADATDPQLDQDRRAWHLAHAAVGPDEQVAAELEQSAQRAMTRGGWSAAANFLERAAELTPDPEPRVTRLFSAAQAHLEAGAPDRIPNLLSAAELNPLSPLLQAELERLRARAAFAVNPGRSAGPRLLAAAQRLENSDLIAARETYLTALGAAVHAGRLGGGDRDRAAVAARAVPAGDETAGLFLSALATWSLDGYAASVPQLKRAMTRNAKNADPGLLWLSLPVAHEIFDDVAWHELSERSVAVARSTGALSVLSSALSFHAGALLYAGRFARAAELIDEMEALAGATGLPPDPSGPLNLLALRGRERETLAMIRTKTSDARSRVEGRPVNMGHHVRAVLFNGLGRHSEALTFARHAAEYPDLGFHHWALSELVEAAALSGDRQTAADGRRRLAARTEVAGTTWARGVQSLADALGGTPADAEHNYQAAIALLCPTRLRLQRTRARLLYGEWLRRVGRSADAGVQLGAAYGAFSAMGAEGFAQRAAGELTALGVRPSTPQSECARPSTRTADRRLSRALLEPPPYDSGERAN